MCVCVCVCVCVFVCFVLHVFLADSRSVSKKYYYDKFNQNNKL